MMAAVKFVFGTGWWIPWHVVLLATLLPLAGVLYWTRVIKLGTGPNGGDMLAMLELMIVLALIIISLVNAVIWGAFQPWSWSTRFLLVPFLVVVAWGAAMAVITVLSDVVIKANATGWGREAAWWGLVAIYGVAYALNLLALADARADI
jgi:hypothetical protein